MRFDVGIGPQSLPYGLLKEIMDHPCLDGGPRSNKIGCTKFCEGYTKGSKVHSKVEINPQSLPYGLLKEIMDHLCSDGGVPEAKGSDVPNLMKDVPNFVEDVPKVPKCVSRWGSAPNYFLIGSKMKQWTIHVQIGNP